jgi:hypothetical protein
MSFDAAKPRSDATIQPRAQEAAKQSTTFTTEARRHREKALSSQPPAPRRLCAEKVLPEFGFFSDLLILASCPVAEATELAKGRRFGVVNVMLYGFERANVGKDGLQVFVGEIP